MLSFVVEIPSQEQEPGYPKKAVESTVDKGQGKNRRQISRSLSDHMHPA
jgi:hypothetical protein